MNQLSSYYIATWNGTDWQITPAVAIAVPVICSGWVFVPSTLPITSTSTSSIPFRQEERTSHTDNSVASHFHVNQTNTFTEGPRSPAIQTPCSQQIPLSPVKGPASTSRRYPSITESPSPAHNEAMADNEVSNNPRRLRVKNDHESVTLYQAFPPEIAEPAIQGQSLLSAPTFSTKRMTWFKTSFTQVMYVSDYAQRDSKRSRILAFRITYCGLEDVLGAAALVYSCDVTTSGEIEKSAPVHIIWDAARTPMGKKAKNKKSMHIGVSGDLLQQLVTKEIISIEDVTHKAYELATIVDRNDQIGAQAFVEGMCEEDMPLENETIEWTLGMV